MLSLHLHVLFALAGFWTTMRPWREMPKSPGEDGGGQGKVLGGHDLYIHRIYIDLWSGNTGWSGIFFVQLIAMVAGSHKGQIV